MKTITNIGKLKGIVILLALMLSGSIFGQKSYIAYNRVNDNNNFTLNNKVEILNAMGIKDFSSYDAVLGFEPWMLNPFNWGIMSEVSLKEEKFFEAEMEFESWMFSTEWISAGKFSEDELELEDWMMSPFTKLQNK
jgi:hypothetical protein